MLRFCVSSLAYGVAVGVVIFGDGFTEGIDGGFLLYITINIILIGQSLFACAGAC